MIKSNIKKNYFFSLTIPNFFKNHLNFHEMQLSNLEFIYLQNLGSTLEKYEKPFI